MSFANDLREWLETDGLGGFASGTVSGIRTRRYHALLLHATHPPTGRMVLINGFEAWVATPSGNWALSSHHYAPDVVHPDGAGRIESFEADPWPRWTFRLEDGTKISQELWIARGSPLVVVSWKLLRPERPPLWRAARATSPVTVGDSLQHKAGVRLSVRPLLSGRDYHALHKANPAFQFEPQREGEALVWHPYPGVPGIRLLSNGVYTHDPQWYRNVLYVEERARGLDHVEDLASPGHVQWDLAQGEAIWILSPAGERAETALQGSASAIATRLRDGERRRRRQFPSRLHRAADDYLVRRGGGQTIVAGYPWFTDWGRDTFISLRGLCLATGRLDEARAILLEWAALVSHGMLPNRFPDHGEVLEFNSVDASLWYVIAVYAWFETMRSCGRPVSPRDQATFQQAIHAILTGYAQGTRFGIRCDADGLLAAGVPGVQLTWMDAKAGDWVVTPRIGKPVEIQALWINALWVGSGFLARWGELFERARETFRARFWNEAGGCLYDVVDVDHQPGKTDASFRPNQLFAVVGYPVALIEGDRARRILDAVEARLWTPMGLRSLAPGEPGYTPHYRGGVRERDGAYHQGTVWPWLIGPFIEAWVRVRGRTAAAKREARRRFLVPLLRYMEEIGFWHLCEIADGAPPHTPRGCPFQAWSVAEVLRLLLVVLQEERVALPRRPRRGRSFFSSDIRSSL